MTPTPSRRRALKWLAAASMVPTVAACAQAAAGRPSGSTGGRPTVIATESFLADIAQNVAGSRLSVGALVPLGVDPHGFEPTPADAARLSASSLIIVNGGGLDAFLDRLMANVGGTHTLIEASAGLKPRTRGDTEAPAEKGEEQDPHFWLDPLLVVQYARNIGDGLTQVDSSGAAEYRAAADAYALRLRDLDAWIREQVKPVPPERRLLVTNHESFGYFADRFGFKIIGTVLPSAGTGAMPSARDMADLTQRIRQTGARAIFLETGSSPQLAQAIGRETGVKVVLDLHTHSLTEPTGTAPTYLEMMRYNVRTIVEALS